MNNYLIYASIILVLTLFIVDIHRNIKRLQVAEEEIKTVLTSQVIINNHLLERIKELEDE